MDTNEWPRIDPDGVKYFEKTPLGIAEFAIDWSGWLAEPGNGATIMTSTWTVPTGITKDSDSKSPIATSIKLSGGVLNASYDCINKIVTEGGDTPLTEERTIRIKVVKLIGR